MVTVAPDGVVTVSVTGDGRVTVAVEPLGVTTWTVLWVAEMASVVVPPLEVKT
jgi:hypothetical protein